ncbi:hypothetical protein [Candidatus Enterovibrio altilux]|uniref:Mobile element protein n=1 Tax=Candidatus Enterovibrio altilux TaxID=1927128 RepID=A0A291B9J2_9GAMM|nr:hypothetical protein BTN50_1152 [Candidatus Enterovibrio luxaltus]
MLQIKKPFGKTLSLWDYNALIDETATIISAFNKLTGIGMRKKRPSNNLLY